MWEGTYQGGGVAALVIFIGMHVRDGDVEEASHKDHAIDLVTNLRGEFVKREEFWLPVTKIIRRSQRQKYDVLGEERIETTGSRLG